MTGVPPLPVPHLPEGWTFQAGAGRAGHLVGVLEGDGHRAEVVLERCAAGRLRAAYPVGAHDVEVRIDPLDPVALKALTEGVLVADPACRRVVVAAAAEDLNQVTTAEAAGYRYVVDVDVDADQQLSLLVTEPEYVTRQSLDVDDLPGT
jgi:hypothetical protein